MASPANASLSRAQTNRANAQHSTGPRTESGKQRAKLNALKHGLTAQTAVLPTEDLAAFNLQLQQFLDEYRPANSTETQLVQELADTSWRLNRIPRLEAGLLDQDLAPQHMIQAIATLGLHGQRLSRQFQKALDQLRTLQAERREREQKELKDAAVVLEFHKRKQIPWDPADSGFVFSKEEVERHATRMSHVVQGRALASTAAFPRVADHIAY